MIRWFHLSLFGLAMALSSYAWAQAELPVSAPVTQDESIPGAASTALPSVDLADTKPHYGLGLRMRWVTVPRFILNLFTKKNMPLSSYSVAIEGMRRAQFKNDPMAVWEIAMGIGYQNLSPKDGNWVGKNDDAEAHTDFVQMRGLGLITWDMTFIVRQYFSPYFGLHYGAGLGLGMVTGSLWRTSAANCTEANAGDTKVCKPIICLGPSCTEAELKASEGQVDLGPVYPHRTRENRVPGALPIIHLLFGLDFPIPDAKGLEFRLECGLYDTLFMGGTMGYVF